MLVVKTRRLLDHLSCQAREKSKDGKSIDNVWYDGEDGNFEMTFDGIQYVPAYSYVDTADFSGIDWKDATEQFLKDK